MSTPIYWLLILMAFCFIGLLTWLFILLVLIVHTALTGRSQRDAFNIRDRGD